MWFIEGIHPSPMRRNPVPTYAGYSWQGCFSHNEAERPHKRGQCDNDYPLHYTFSSSSMRLYARFQRFVFGKDFLLRNGSHFAPFSGIKSGLGFLCPKLVYSWVGPI